jgi:RNA-directed DNA polymerase
MAVKKNAAGGKGPCSGHAGGGGKGEGMVRTAGPNHPGGQPPIDKVRRLQRKLYGAAKQHRERRFHALYDRVHRSDVLWEGAACNDVDQAGESPAAAVARFGCVAMPDIHGG